MKKVCSISFLFFLGVQISVAQDTCHSSFQFKNATNSAANIQPLNNGATHQLYSSSGFTWEAWLKLNGPITYQSVIICMEDQTPFEDIFLGFGWGNLPNALSFLVRDDGTSNATEVVESFQDLTIGTWYHIAAVCDYNNAQILLYLNGNLLATKALTTNITDHKLTADLSAQIGNASVWARNNVGDFGIDANIDEVRFWNTARTQKQIIDNMNICTPETTNLVAFFKADENKGTVSASAVNTNFTTSLDNTSWGNQTPGLNCSPCKLITDTIYTTTCYGDTIHFGMQNLTESGEYSQTFQSAQGYDSLVLLNLNVLPVFIATINATFCSGAPYTLPWGAVINQPGIYNDTLHYTIGCDSIINSVNLTALEKPKPDLGRDSSICNQQSFLISPGIFSSYIWQDGSTQSTYKVTKAGIYSVTVSNTCDTASDELNIKDTACDIYFPTAFTPNGDGLNDVFKVVNGFKIDAGSYHLQIYNRLGQTVFETANPTEAVFETTNPTEAWNGSYKNLQHSASAETFAWYAIFKVNNNPDHRKGTVTLIK